MDMLPQSEAEMEAIRNAVIKEDGLLLSVLDVLRRVPRRVLMVLKLNDLTRCAFLQSSLIISYSMRQQEPRSCTHDDTFKCRGYVVVACTANGSLFRLGYS